MPNPYDGPEYQRLLERARRSLERTGGDLSGSVSLGDPGDAERKAIIGLEHVKLSGTPQPAPWDPELTQVMVTAGRVLFEETVADDLIRDLSGA